MPNIFTPRANPAARAVVAGAVFGLPVAMVGAYVYGRSPYVTGEGVEVQQPIPFSHRHHVAGLGIDCRYCHESVESDAFAGMPAAQTCMTCHAKVWTDATILEPLRQAWRSGMPVSWRRAYNLPDFVYFNHSIHVAKGVGCSTCHGRVDEMPLVRKAVPLFMGWCIDCHRDPGPNLRATHDVFNMKWRPSNDPIEQQLLVRERGIVSDGLANCSTCHR